MHSLVNSFTLAPDEVSFPCCSMKRVTLVVHPTAPRVVVLLQFNHPEYTSSSHKVQPSDRAKPKQLPRNWSQPELNLSAAGLALSGTVDRYQATSSVPTRSTHRRSTIARACFKLCHGNHTSSLFALVLQQVLQTGSHAACVNSHIQNERGLLKQNPGATPVWYALRSWGSTDCAGRTVYLPPGYQPMALPLSFARKLVTTPLLT
jgi:hypothetical protein|eukprot:COSAG02_NODE_6_length_64796_cov_76.792865_3_plen_205_part_00